MFCSWERMTLHHIGNDVIIVPSMFSQAHLYTPEPKNNNDTNNPKIQDTGGVEQDNKGGEQDTEGILNFDHLKNRFPKRDEARLVLFPVNYNNYHWYVNALYLNDDQTKGTIVCFDSLETFEHPKEKDKQYQMLCKDLFGLKELPTFYPADELLLGKEGLVPKQDMGSNDCGLFTCQYIYGLYKHYCENGSLQNFEKNSQRHDDYFEFLCKAINENMSAFGTRSQMKKFVEKVCFEVANNETGSNYSLYLYEIKDTIENIKKGGEALFAAFSILEQNTRQGSLQPTYVLLEEVVETLGNKETSDLC